ncbi:SDR family oxidoreductase [Mycolicibacterium arenosum]|uniref:NAD(P)H-binding protein n=1 Tax=Mycolicibacterium arenosum TaxID=2952157 RepID=A0ABT1MAI8_9MYCO|nr:NAD(P)H-binding protein [Mycolicibacterium sp. CAU 1645]MCP9274812.1 NAD(P)H-binding protein [Mycolicibacterium sp. CAU 1645]
MKVTVVGATGQIGTQLVPLLTRTGHRVVAASRASGVDAAIGTGLGEALRDADVLVDVLNAPSTEDDAALSFFTGTSANLSGAARAAGVQHYVLLSIVGVGELPGGYMRGKLVQEQTVAASGVPYTVVRATQFHQLTDAIAGSLIVDGEVRVPDAMIEPIASADVVSVLARLAGEPAADGVLEVGGPERMSFADMAAAVLASRGEELPIVVDPDATYFGIPIRRDSLVTGPDAEHGATSLREHLAQFAT